MPKPQTYIVPEQLPVARIEQWIQRMDGAPDGSERSSLLSYLDTHDWRVYRSNAVLEQLAQAGQIELRLARLYDRKLIAMNAVRETPRYGFQLPPGPLRKKIDLVAEVSPLEIKARCASRSRHYVIRNSDGKITLRIQMESVSILDEDGEPHPLAERLRLQPVKGYKDSYTRARKSVAQDLKLNPVHEDLLLLMLRETGNRGWSDDRGGPLRRNFAAASKVCKRLIGWAQTMDKQDSGVRAGRDPEHLHDYRVALRRTRTAISQLRICFPKTRLKPYSEKFRRLARATGDARDLDVQNGLLKREIAALAVAERPGSRRIAKLLQIERSRARRAMLKQLASSEHQKLMRSWRAFLENGEMEAILSSGVPYTLDRIAADSAGRLFDRALHRARSLEDQPAAHDLHDLRKSLKRLRYGLELFDGLYRTRLKPLMVPLKQLQDTLGHIQDLGVQSTLLDKLEGRLTTTARGVSTFEARIFSLWRERIRSELAQQNELLETRLEQFRSRETRQRYAELDVRTDDDGDGFSA